MFLNNIILFDFSLENYFFYIVYNKKIFSKKIKSLEKTENISIIFNKFIELKKAKIDNSFVIYVNIGPGNTIAIRNSIVLAKTISLIFGCNIFGYSNFDLLKLNKYKKKKALLIFKKKKIFLDIKKKKVLRLSSTSQFEIKKNKVNINYSYKLLKNLVLLNNFTKKVVPISFSSI